MPTAPDNYAIFLSPLPKNRLCRTYTSPRGQSRVGRTSHKGKRPHWKGLYPSEGGSDCMESLDHCSTTTGNDWPECCHLVADCWLCVESSLNSLIFPAGRYFLIYSISIFTLLKLSFISFQQRLPTLQLQTPTAIWHPIFGRKLHLLSLHTKSSLIIWRRTILAFPLPRVKHRQLSNDPSPLKPLTSLLHCLQWFE